MSIEYERDLMDNVDISDDVVSATVDTQYGVMPYRVVIREPIIIKNVKVNGNNV